MIMIPEATLTGETNEPALAADRSWALDADQARALAGDPHAEHQWYEGMHPPPDRADADVDVLTVTYTGRYPPQRLREAIIFRDGHCQITGLHRPRRTLRPRPPDPMGLRRADQRSKPVEPYVDAITD